MTESSTQNLYESLLSKVKKRSTLDDFLYTSDSWKNGFRGRNFNRRTLSQQNEVDQSMLKPPRREPAKTPAIEKEKEIIEEIKKEEKFERKLKFPQFSLINEKSFPDVEVTVPPPNPKLQQQKMQLQQRQQQQQQLQRQLSAQQWQRNPAGYFPRPPSAMNPAMRMQTLAMQPQQYRQQLSRTNSLQFGPNSVFQQNAINQTMQHRAQAAAQASALAATTNPPQQQLEDKDMSLDAEIFDAKRRIEKENEHSKEARNEVKFIGQPAMQAHPPQAQPPKPPPVPFDQIKRMQEYNQLEKEKRLKQEQNKLQLQQITQNMTDGKGEHIFKLVNALSASSNQPPVRQPYAGIPSSQSVASFTQQNRTMSQVISPTIAAAQAVQQRINAGGLGRPGTPIGLPPRPGNPLQLYSGAQQARSINQITPPRTPSTPVNDIPPAQYVNNFLLRKEFGLISSQSSNIPVQVDKSDKSIRFTDQTSNDSPYGIPQTRNQAPLEWNTLNFHDSNYYTNLKVSRENRMHQNIQHSDPALNLILVEPNLKDFENFHHPFLNTKDMLGKPLTVNYDPDKPVDDDQDTQVSPFLKNLKDLSGKRGGIIVIEQTAEYPTFITNVGMASTLVTYWHRAHSNDNPRTIDQHLHILEPDQQSPFIAEIPKNEPVLCCSCNLFNVPLAKHPVEPTDFLLIKSKSKPVFYIRHIDQMYCAGLLEARQRVMRPGTKDAQKFNISFITAVLINIFRGTELYPGKRRIQVQSVIREFFPDVNEPKLRGVLKDFADFYREQGNGYWRLKPSANPDQSFQKIDISPEEVCSYQSMLVGHYRLKKSGVNILIRSKRVYQQIQRLQGELTKKVAEKIEIELMKTPWARTENFVKAFEGQVMQIQHTEDGQQIMRTKSRRGKSDSTDGDSPAPQKKQLAGTDADLRALTLKELRDKLMALGVPPSDIEKLGRWKQVALLRELANSKAQQEHEEGSTKEDAITEKFSRGPRNDYAASLQKYKKVYQDTFLNNLNFISSTLTNPSKIDFDEGHILDDIGLQMMREATEEEEEEVEVQEENDERKKRVIEGGDPPELVPYGLATHKFDVSWEKLGFGGYPMRKAAKIIKVSLSGEGRPVVEIQWRRIPHQIQELEKLESFVNTEQAAKSTKNAEDLETYTLRSRRKQLLDKLRRTNQAIKNKGPSTQVLWYLTFAHQEILVTDPGGQLRFQFTPEVKKKIVEASIKYQNYIATHARSHTKKKKSGSSNVVETRSDEEDDDAPETMTFKTTRRTSAVTRFNEKLMEIVQKLINDVRFEVFVAPVQKKYVPDYYKVITNPKCLKDIERAVKNDDFTTVNTFYSEMSVIRSNCKLYNETRNPDIYKMGETLWECFISLLQENREDLDEIAQEIDPVLRK